MGNVSWGNHISIDIPKGKLEEPAILTAKKSEI